ncbi:MAG: hypothetical protein IAG10_18045 [Planctomycetaceae bacterium]|nr:hypothetical protein [Planctomycetaceae bacterium]
MSGWLSRAKGAFGGREAETAPEPIEIACPCGRKVEATRRRAFQRVLCKGCGEPFFLLPLDVYPRPVMKIRKVKPPKPATKAKSAPAKQDAKTETAPTRPSVDLQKELSVFAGQVRAQLTPLRLIVVCLLAVIGLTGWWQWTRAARSSAELDFKTASEAGQVALQKKDFVEAAQQFARAADAADILQRHDVPAEQVRQHFRQLTAINSLLTRSLAELLEAAKAGRLKGDFAAVESEFASLHAGRWVVLQSEVAPASDPSNTKTVSVWELRVQMEGEAFVLTGSLPIFSKVPATAPTPAAPDENATLDAQPQLVLALNDLGQREVLFAAQVESLKWNGAQSVWVLTLKSSSSFLWTDYDLLEPTGLQPDELRTEPQLRALLLEQSRWIGAAE